MEFRLADVRVAGSWTAIRSRGGGSGTREGRRSRILETRQNEVVTEVRVFGIVYERFDFEQISRGFRSDRRAHHFRSFRILGNGVVPGDGRRDVRIRNVVHVCEPDLLSGRTPGSDARLEVFHVVEELIPRGARKDCRSSRPRQGVIARNERGIRSVRPSARQEGSKKRESEVGSFSRRFANGIHGSDD